MTNNEPTNKTIGVLQEPISESASQIAKKPLKFIKQYWKTSCSLIEKAGVITQIAKTLSAAMPEFTKAELTGALGLYLNIIAQHDHVCGPMSRPFLEHVVSLKQEMSSPISMLWLWMYFHRFFTILFDLLFTFYQTESAKSNDSNVQPHQHGTASHVLTDSEWFWMHSHMTWGHVMHVALSWTCTGERICVIAWYQ